MLPVENDSEADGSQNKETKIIIPPPDIKLLVDDTAKRVALVGLEFEKSLTADDAGTRKYSFLYPEDPYHAYYQHRLSELRAQNAHKITNTFSYYSSNRRKNVTDLSTDSERSKEIKEFFRILVERQAAARAAAEAKAVVSPITGELVPAYKMLQHMQTCETDPKYKEETERLFAKIREATDAPDTYISSTIVRLAETRPDVFGTSEEELCNAVWEEIESTLATLHLDDTQAMSTEDRVLGSKRQQLEDQFLGQHHQGVPEKERMQESSSESVRKRRLPDRLRSLGQFIVELRRKEQGLDDSLVVPKDPQWVPEKEPSVEEKRRLKERLRYLRLRQSVRRTHGIGSSSKEGGL